MNNGIRAELKVVGAYTVFGVLPIFWRLLHDLRAEQVLIHRTLWAVVFLALWLMARGHSLPAIIDKFRRTPGPLILSASMLGINWITYLYALKLDRLLEASLGYFLAPICSIALGAVVFAERLTRQQTFAVALLMLGVGVKTAAVGSLPWFALAIAVSFSTYTLTRKRCALGAGEAMFVEAVLLLAPVMWIGMRGEGTSFWSESIALNAYLVASGAVTVLPMICLMSGARNVSMQFLGVSQYVTPTISFVVAATRFGEPVTQVDVVSFGIIWAGIALFLLDGVRRTHILRCRTPLGVEN